MSGRSRDLHTGPVATAGAPVEEAELALVLVHGRGATPESILPLGEEILRAADVAPERIALLAPRADGGSWYPYAFVAPTAANEPYLSAGLGRLGEIVVSTGLPRRRVALVGFSQGGCLALEHAARAAASGTNGPATDTADAARPWAFVGGLSAGLIGPPGTSWDHLPAGALAGTPVFLGCSDRDAHIPLERLHESRRVFERLGAEVDERIYPGLPHTVIRDEVDALGRLLASSLASSSTALAVSGIDLA